MATTSLARCRCVVWWYLLLFYLGIFSSLFVTDTNARICTCVLSRLGFDSLLVQGGFKGEPAFRNDLRNSLPFLSSGTASVTPEFYFPWPFGTKAVRSPRTDLDHRPNLCGSVRVCCLLQNADSWSFLGNHRFVSVARHLGMQLHGLLPPHF